MQDERTHGERRKAAIIDCGLALWRNGELVSARRIGKMIDMTHSAVLYHFGNADGLRSAVAQEAVRIGDTVIIPMLIATKNPAVNDMPGSVRARYLAGC